MTQPTYHFKTRGIQTYNYELTAREDKWLTLNQRISISEGGSPLEIYNIAQNLIYQLGKIRIWIVYNYGAELKSEAMED